MRIHLAVIGSNEFLALLRQLLEMHPSTLPTDEFVLHEHSYERFETIEHDALETPDQMDAWIYSDELACHLAATRAALPKTCVVSRDALTLVAAIAQYERESGDQVEAVSVDSMCDEEVQDALVALPHLKHVYRYQRPLSSELEHGFEDLLTFHQVNGRDRRVLCISGSRLVVERLQAARLPSLFLPYREKSVIHQLTALLHEIKSEQFKRSQVAIQIVQVSNFNQLMNQNHAFYDIYRTYLKTQGLLLDYTEQVLGTFVSIGNGRFMIFSTRGIVENQMDRANQLLQQITGLTKLAANIGMGYGTTAIEAEKNARLALNHAEHVEHGGCMYLVDETGALHGPLQNLNKATIKFRTDDKELSKRLHHAKLSIVTFERMLSVQEASAQKCITAAVVSEILGMSERNARKILASLHGNDLAEVVGHETPTTKGRPRKIYRIKG